jgi:hypothetical protein
MHSRLLTSAHDLVTWIAPFPGFCLPEISIPILPDFPSNAQTSARLQLQYYQENIYRAWEAGDADKAFGLLAPLGDLYLRAGGFEAAYAIYQALVQWHQLAGDDRSASLYARRCQSVQGARVLHRLRTGDLATQDRVLLQSVLDLGVFSISESNGGLWLTDEWEWTIPLSPLLLITLRALSKRVDEEVTRLEDDLVKRRPWRTRVSANLPPRTQPFMGREREISFCLEALSPADRGWGIAIEGMSGIGKTSLALEAAHIALERAWFDAYLFATATAASVALSSTQQEVAGSTVLAGFVRVFARLLGHDEVLWMGGDEERSNALRAILQGQRALLIFDGVEILRPQDADAFTSFLRTLPGSNKAIVTSRQQVGDGAISLKLLPLSHSDDLAFRMERSRAQLDLEGEAQLEVAQSLNLSGSKLTALPADLGHRADLQALDLSDNQLSTLPSEIGQLAALKVLDLSDNQLSTLPSEIGQLTALKVLKLSGNRLRTLPPELGQLTALTVLDLSANPDLISPPPEIVVRGAEDILVFLRQVRAESVQRFEAKLLVLGEGGAGKSSVLRALRGDSFVPHLETTHGIAIDRLGLHHPQYLGTTITLNTWDFGGQQIYHAMHQFFLTRRSLYLVVYNARMGAEQGRLSYWLETIRALAPDARVVLVATHIDERLPDLNFQLYHQSFPNLAGHVGISNANGAGLEDLRRVLASEASELSLMGQPWPGNWLAAEKALMRVAERAHHIDAAHYVSICAAYQVDAETAAGTLGNYLHDLGVVLYFRDDDVLRNLVVLKPNWVTDAINRVLADETVRRARGVLAHAELGRIWAAYERTLYPTFLRLMERFDLSYQLEAEAVGQPPTHSLVPQLLPFQPPPEAARWAETPPDQQRQMTMVYRMNFVPAGIVPWFIVRTHRYGRDIHWREGVLLEYDGHQARVEINPIDRELRLVVRGVLPLNFFTILRNTVDLILDRFVGLQVTLEVPCNCHVRRHVSTPCPRMFTYHELVSYDQSGEREIFCTAGKTRVPVRALLYGVHDSTQEAVLIDMLQTEHAILDERRQGYSQQPEKLQELDALMQLQHQQAEWIARGFARQWNLEMQKLEAECPSTFSLEPRGSGGFDPREWLRNAIGQEFQLYLICQHPAGPHTVGDGYRVRKAKEWWIAVGPWLRELTKFLKFAIPMGSAIGGAFDELAFNRIKGQADLLEEIVQELPDAAGQGHGGDLASGAALRALHAFLVEADNSRAWGGLLKMVTPDGNILWLCRQHRQPYEESVLVIEPSP